MMSVTEALKRTPKGQLQYTRQLDILKLKHELNQLSPPPLSRYHEEKESSKLNLSFGLDPAQFESILTSKKDYNENSCRNLVEDGVGSDLDTRIAKDGEEKSDLSKEDILDLRGAFPYTTKSDIDNATPHSVTKIHPASCPVSPEFGYTSCAILDADKEWASSAQLSLSERRSQFDHHDRALTFLMKSKWKEVKNRLEQMAESRKTQLDKKLLEGQEEANRNLQRLRENHEEHLKRISWKQREIERQREMMEEEERKRKEENLGKLQSLRQLLKEIDGNRREFIQLQDSFPHRDQLSEIVNKFRAVLDKVCTGLDSQMNAAQHSASVPDELVSKFEEHREKSRYAVNVIKKQIDDVEQKMKADAEKKREEEVKKAQQQQQADQVKKQEENAARDLAVQALAYVIKEKSSLSKKLEEMEANIQPFTGNSETKKYRFDLQRAVNTPINAISGLSGSHLWDKVKRLHSLLTGQVVEVAGKNVTVRDNASALCFSQNLVARMLVKKGEEQVSCKHESAFAIGAVVVTLWSQFPVIGELFMAHLQAACPYVLPFYSTRQEGQSSTDYCKSLGYKVMDDGTLEEHDKFLRRMSGLMRLYCACMVAQLPPNASNNPHPHGVENVWMWLARTMNLEPQSDVTAAMIYDVLSVTGHALFREYRVQFAKLLHLLYKSYLPKLESVSVTNATVGRLRTFLETAMQTAKIPPPEGLLPQDFWSS